MSNRHLVAAAAAVHEKIMTCSNIYSVARMHGLLGCCEYAMCVLLRRSVETEMHLAARILLPFGLPPEKRGNSEHAHSLTQTHTLLSVYASVLYLACLLWCARETAVGGCLDDPHTNTRELQVLLVFTPSPVVLSSAYYDDACLSAR